MTTQAEQDAAIAQIQEAFEVDDAAYAQGFKEGLERAVEICANASMDWTVASEFTNGAKHCAATIRKEIP